MGDATVGETQDQLTTSVKGSRLNEGDDDDDDETEALCRHVHVVPEGDEEVIEVRCARYRARYRARFHTRGEVETTNTSPFGW